MKITHVFVETTIKIDFSAQDIGRYIREKDLVPCDQAYFSTDVIGNGISGGAQLIIRFNKNETL